MREVLPPRRRTGGGTRPTDPPASAARAERAYAERTIARSGRVDTSDPDAQPGQTRREFPRVSAVRPVLLAPASSSAPRGASYTLDLSGGGLLVSGPRELPLGETTWFALDLSPGVPPIGGQARVVRETEQGHKGLRIEQVAPRDRELLLRYTLGHNVNDGRVAEPDLQRRQYPRIRAVRPVLLAVGRPDAPRVVTRTLNIGAGGAQLALSGEPPVGEPVWLAISLADDEPQVAARGRVVWRSPGSAGVTVEEVAPGDRGRLAQFGARAAA